MALFAALRSAETFILMKAALRSVAASRPFRRAPDSASARHRRHDASVRPADSKTPSPISPARLSICGPASTPGRSDKRPATRIPFGAAQLVQCPFLPHHRTGVQIAERLHVFAHDLDRQDRLCPGVAQVQEIADRHRQRRPSLRQFGQRRQRPRDRQWRPEIRTDRRRHEHDPARRARGRGRPNERFAITHVLGKPEAVGSGFVGLTGRRQHLGRRGQSIEKYARAHHFLQ